MYLNEVLQLDKTMQSIKKIDLFLAGCNKKSTDYYKAFAYRSIILHSLGKTNEALKALYSFAGEFSKLGDAEIIAICDAIIEITLSIEKFDQTRKFMDEKKKHLKVSNSLLNMKDEIHLAIAKKDYHRAIAELKQYSNEILTTQETSWALEQLSSIYYEVHNFKAYLEIVPELEKIYQDTLNTNRLIELEYRKLEIAFTEGNYIKVICEGNRILNDYDLETETIMMVATLLLEAYIQSKDYRRASIIESNYEEFISNVSPETALAFCKVCLELYTQTSSLISMKHYEDWINELSQNKKKTKAKTEVARTGVIIPKVKDVEESKEPEENHLPNIHELTKDVHTVYVSTNYTKLEKLYKILNELDDSIKFREIFRRALIELSKFVPFEEAYILYYDRGYNGIHYKKERAYDKRLEYEQVSDTINMLAISQEQEIYLDRHSTEGRINIVTQKAYVDIPYGIAIPLKKDDVAFASIAFWGMEPFIDMELVYETLKLISQMLRRSLANELKQNTIKASNKKMFFIYEHMSSGVKELMEGHIHLSNQAKNILGSLEDINEADFLAHIHPSNVVAYTSLVEELYKSLAPNQSIEYQYKKNGEYVEIKETFFPCYENGIISLYSLIEDHTKVKVQKDELYDIAYTHPISKLSTEAKLGMDIQNLLEHRKLSLAIFDIHDAKFYEEIYGLNLVNQLICAVADEMKNYFSSNFQIQLYHLGFDRYAILAVDINDKRTMDHLLLDAFTKVSNHLSVLNSRIKLYFNCGVFRLSKNANIQDPNKLLDFAYDALSDAKSVQEVGHHISHYDSEASKLRFAEHQLITQISESIDHGKLGILYKQLIYLTEKQVYAYIAHVTMDNYEIDPSYMNKVIERKSLEEQIDKYVIRCCSKELKMLGDVSKSSIPILIPLSKKTLEANFVAFVENQNHFYKTTKKLIFYYADGAHMALKKLKALGYKVATSNVVDVLQGNTHYYIHDVTKYGFDGILDLIRLCKEKEVKFILSQVTTKEEVLKAAELGIEYIYGNYWKKSIRMNKVIEKFA